MELSVVHPCYNEQENIEYTVRETLRWFDGDGHTGEVIVVDDGSSDESPAILRRLSVEDSRVKVVTHEKNQGYGIAVRSGCDSATMPYIAFVDSDGQFKIEDLNRLIPQLKDADFVPGRRLRRADPFIRNVFGKVLGVLNLAFFGMWIRDVNCGMKIFTKELWPTIRPVYGTEKFFNTELYLRMKHDGRTWEQVPVPHYPRRAGTQTGGSIHVIFGMMKELLNLRGKINHDRRNGLMQNDVSVSEEEREVVSVS